MSQCNFAQAQDQFDPSNFHDNYLAKSNEMPTWLVRPAESPALEAGSTACWPDYPFKDPSLFPGNHSLGELRGLVRPQRK
jgi:hypothetical protein